MNDMEFLVEKVRREAQEIVNSCDEYQVEEDIEKKRSALAVVLAKLVSLQYGTTTEFTQAMKADMESWPRG